MDMTNETLIVLCWELYEQGMPKTRIAQRLEKHRETIHLWIKSINRVGLLVFLDKYKQAKKGVLVACIRKLITILNAMMRTMTVWKSKNTLHPVPVEIL